MAKVFKRNNAAIRKLLQSADMLRLTEKYARGRAGGDGEIKPFIGFDRAKTIVYTSNKEKNGW